MSGWASGCYALLKRQLCPTEMSRAMLNGHGTVIGPPIPLPQIHRASNSHYRLGLIQCILVFASPSASPLSSCTDSTESLSHPPLPPSRDPSVIPPLSLAPLLVAPSLPSLLPNSHSRPFARSLALSLALSLPRLFPPSPSLLTPASIFYERFCLQCALLARKSVQCHCALGVQSVPRRTRKARASPQSVHKVCSTPLKTRAKRVSRLGALWHPVRTLHTRDSLVYASGST